MFPPFCCNIVSSSCFYSLGARNVAQRRRRPRLQPLWLLPAPERRHPARLLHNAANRHLRAQNPAGPGILKHGERFDPEAPPAFQRLRQKFSVVLFYTTLF